MVCNRSPPFLSLPMEVIIMVFEHLLNLKTLSSFVVDTTQASIDDYRRTSNVIEKKTLPFSIFALEDFQSFGRKTVYLPRDETRLKVTPIQDAAARGKEDVVAILLKSSNLNDRHQDASALSLALYSGNVHVAELLLNRGARPGCGRLINSLHAAARHGLNGEIELFVKFHGMDVDIEDKDGETPVMHALRLPEDQASETIRLLFKLGARIDLEIGERSWTYSALARLMGMHMLADELAAGVLEEAAGEAADDRSSSCTMDVER
ncbi:ankyrin repeat-containing domain protein [Fusarium solani]|uniref:Ankyrin repeat-containing domain protein n=1 Tax=Fusarium solani TaxID=169388 RepID=A0A9P9JZ04_FUSSL|nr:ankyrin repeat-containing domain protein [Fusarium solani]KAH7237900.1 ankyrin repeat-containing domain protein [Fusarium solani]